jgi:hypothetical protein
VKGKTFVIISSLTLALVLVACVIVLLVTGLSPLTDVEGIQTALQGVPTVMRVRMHVSEDRGMIGAVLDLSGGRSLDFCCLNDTAVEKPVKFSIYTVGPWMLRVDRRTRTDGQETVAFLPVGTGGLAEPLLGVSVRSVSEAVTQYDQILAAIEKWPAAPEKACTDTALETICYSRRPLAADLDPWPSLLPPASR